VGGGGGREHGEGLAERQKIHCVRESSMFIIAPFYTYFNKQLCQGTGKKTKCKLEEDAGKKAPQTTHSEVSVPK
jgi:hypothetical protein